MNNLKKWIIIVILVIVVCLILVIFIRNDNKNVEEAKISSEDNYITDTETKRVFEKPNFIEATEQEYYCNAQYITNFLNALAFDDATSAYEMLDKRYASENEINEGNIIEKLKFSNKYQEFEATDMSKLNLTENSTIIVVHGNIREKGSEDGKKKFLECIVNIDNVNSTFSITPYRTNTLNKEKLDTTKLTDSIVEIEENSNNNYTVTITNQKIKATKLFNKYISEALYYTDIAYESLDEEYRNLRFGSLEKYKEYISENAKYIENLVIDSYGVTKKTDYNEYRIIDNCGNTYLFNVTNLLNYSLKLDEYTIPTDEFIQAYNQGDIHEKVSLNIGKFFDMINAKDYNSAYNCLSEGFRQNYFKTVEEFKVYMQENFFEINSLTGVELSNEGEIYMATVNISDYKNNNTNVVKKTFIMQLGSGIDFVMSFNVEQ